MFSPFRPQSVTYTRLQLLCQLLRDMCIINIKPFLVRISKQVRENNQIIEIEGFWKYGDRCTFAHGEVDLRAKFVPASSLYSSIPSQPPTEPVSQISAAYGSIDYGAFSQPPEAIPSYVSGVPGQDNPYSYMYGTDPGSYQVNEMPPFPSQLPGKFYQIIHSTLASICVQ